MATKSKLEQAVEARLSGLNDAQREIAKSQLSVYKRNQERLRQVESELKVVEATRTATLEEVRLKQSQRMALTYEHNQLAASSSEIASKLFEFMEE